MVEKSLGMHWEIGPFEVGKLKIKGIACVKKKLNIDCGYIGCFHWRAGKGWKEH